MGTLGQRALLHIKHNYRLTDNIRNIVWCSIKFHPHLALTFSCTGCHLDEPVQSSPQSYFRVIFFFQSGVKSQKSPTATASLHMHSHTCWVLRLHIKFTWRWEGSTQRLTLHRCNIWVKADTVCFTTCLSFRWQNTVLIWMTSTLLWRWIQNKIYSAFGQDGLNHCNKGHLAALNEHISAVTVITLWWRRLKTNIMQQRFLERIVQ